MQEFDNNGIFTVVMWNYCIKVYVLNTKFSHTEFDFHKIDSKLIRTLIISFKS